MESISCLRWVILDDFSFLHQLQTALFGSERKVAYSQTGSGILPQDLEEQHAKRCVTGVPRQQSSLRVLRCAVLADSVASVQVTCCLCALAQWHVPANHCAG